MFAGGVDFAECGGDDFHAGIFFHHVIHHAGEGARIELRCRFHLRTFDAKGFRRDIVEFHPAYHRFMAQSMAEAIHCSMWRDCTGLLSSVSRKGENSLNAQTKHRLHLTSFSPPRAS